MGGPTPSPPDLAQRTEEVLRLCRDAGFALAGVADASPSQRREELTAWLADGRHGSMAWLAETAAVRAEPARLLEGTRAIVMVADPYPGGEPQPGPPGAGGAHGRVARYARGDDYHVVMKRRLHRVCDALREAHPGERFRAFVDTAPAPERELAWRAGLGWIGKHTLLIHPRLGSFLFLGGFATTLALDPAPREARVADHCGACTRCIDACPTGAISPYAVDARRCISYLTIEHRAPVEDRWHAPIGDRLYGCDVCQEVCPHNARAADRGVPERVRPAYLPRRESLDLLEVLGWDEAARRRRFERSAMKRANLAMMKRNALIAAGNLLAARDEPALRARIERIAADDAEDEMVRRTAAAVARRLESGPPAPGKA